MSAEDERLPVLVVGAGPTGLTAAVELARRGIACRVFDAAPGPRTWARATIVHGRTLEIFETLGIAEETLARGLHSRGVTFYSREKKIARADFSDAPTRYPFELTLSEEHTEAILRDRLAQECVPVEWDRSLIDFTRDALSVRAVFRRGDGTEDIVRGGWMIGCDGYHSVTRRLLGERFHGSDADRDWAVLDCRLEGWPLPEDEVTVFLEHDGLVFVPLPEREWRVYFRPTGPDVDLLADVQKGLDEHLSGVRVVDASEQARFRTHSRLVRSYRHGRVFLAGDAAHVCSPIEGHGMNTGIQDAHNLAWKLALVESGACSDVLLESYERERRPVAEAVCRSGEEAEGMQALEDPEEIERRDAELAATDEDPVARRHRAEAVCELDATYRGSAIVAGDEGPTAGSPGPGDRLPDAGVVAADDGRRSELPRLCDGTLCTILCVLRSPPEEGLAERLRVLQEVAVRHRDLVDRVLVVADRRAPDESLAARWWVADDATPFETLGVAAEALFVVRPDRFVGFRANAIEPARADAYLRALRYGRVA